MLLTRECDYAIRILRALSAGGIVSVQRISETEHIGLPIIYKISRKLEKAGFITSHRGLYGGYSIRRPLDEVNLFDVCSVLAPDLRITKCVGCGHVCSRDTEEHMCKVHCELCRIQSLLLDELKRNPLSTLFDEKEPPEDRHSS